MVQAALERGLDLIAITDHTWCEDVIQACRNETRLICLPGMEISNTQHIVGLGLSKAISAAQPYEEIIAQIHAQGGLAIAAHPFLDPYRYDESVLTGLDFDAMECWRSSLPEDDAHQQELSTQYGIPCVHDSDAHARDQLGLRYMDCSVQVTNLLELKIAIENGLCQKRP